MRNGCYVVLIVNDNAKSTTESITLSIAGYELYFPGGNTADFYDGETFISLNEAYKRQLLTKGDLSDLELVFPDPDNSKAVLKEKIISAWFKKFGYYNIADPYIDTLYRTENGGYVVRIVDRQALYNDVFITMDLYGYELCFENSNLPLYYENGELYDFDECPLTEKDAKGLSKIFGNPQIDK